jgi:hypothetical protein
MIIKRKETSCTDCSATLEKDEIALSKKLFGKDITTFYCLNCAAGIIDCDISDLKDKIQEFKEQGCALFL